MALSILAERRIAKREAMKTAAAGADS